ncbi:glycosyltransferase family 2 protein [Thermoproteota archaeon]
MNKISLKANPKISVILHIRKSGEELKKCLSSLLDQTIPHEWYEIITIDDASTDKTAEILDTFNDSLNILRNETFSGGPKSRNLGAHHAQGRIILFTAADCIADKRLLEEHLASHSLHDNCAVVGNIDWIELEKKSYFIDFLEQSRFWVCQKPSDIPDPTNVHYTYTYGANLSLLKKTYATIGMADERIFPGYYSDTELGYRLYNDGIRIVYNKNAKVFHSTDLNISNFSKRMIAVGRAAVKLESINPEVLDFSNWKKEKYSIFKLRFLTKQFLFIALTYQFFERFNYGQNVRARLFEVYKRQLDYSFRLGFARELKFSLS